ncbi:hypothetical protein C9374_000752 [Naegleria lovaniensis]|uniref:VOC domain-containing protein n=1 Tax=Naegleria lovaniensis TaxID=51637 RepID=A0AA88GVQ7_NAELO|nr:uncharacterized protein C9374_000752 [Naegleria lovaniensis]KAG2387902.1 hypothetical protein C9374_000752 [Naegleria lovaniensis]
MNGNLNSYVIGVDHVRFHVDNALQSSAYYCSHLGFTPMAYEGLETGNKDFCTHVVRQNEIILAFTSALHKAPCRLELNTQLHPYLYTNLSHCRHHRIGSSTNHHHHHDNNYNTIHNNSTTTTSDSPYIQNDPIYKFYESIQSHGSNHAHDLALLVSNVEKAFEQACKHPKTIPLSPPTRIYCNHSDDEDYIEFACVATQFGEKAWIHTLINRDHQKASPFSHQAHCNGHSNHQHYEEEQQGVFLPSFKNTCKRNVSSIGNYLEYLDHFAIAIPKGTLVELIGWYSQALGFERFYNNDDEDQQKGIQIKSSEKDLGGLTTMVVAPSLLSSLNRHIELHGLGEDDRNTISEKELHERRELIASKVMKKMIKFVLIEPVNTKHSKSQIQEFLDYHDGPGVAHLAVHTEDIINAVSKSRKVGVDYISVPPTYYKTWREEKAELYNMVVEDWALLEENTILVDGIVFPKDQDLEDTAENSSSHSNNFRYLLQTFTKPIEDRPTFYFEIISRRGNSGFGKGNIKALFDAIERLQLERGNLFIDSNGSK